MAATGLPVRAEATAPQCPKENGGMAGLRQLVLAVVVLVVLGWASCTIGNAVIRALVTWSTADLKYVFPENSPEEERSVALARDAHRRVGDRLHPPIGDLPQRRPKQRIGLAEAEALLGDFWHHAQCDFSPTTRTHLFFYGTRNLDETGVVVVVTRGPADDQVVDFLTSEDNERLFLYDGCTDLDLSVTKGERE